MLWILLIVSLSSWILWRGFSILGWLIGALAGGIHSSRPVYYRGGHSRYPVYQGSGGLLAIGRVTALVLAVAILLDSPILDLIPSVWFNGVLFFALFSVVMSVFGNSFALISQSVRTVFWVCLALYLGNLAFSLTSFSGPNSD